MGNGIIITGNIKTESPALRNYLVCGILSSVYYIALAVFIPMLWDEYSSVTQTVSELSAFNAPTRTIWVVLCSVYIILFAFFGWGVLKVADNKSLRIVGGLILAYCIVNLYWPPMHSREVLASGGGTISDTLHIVWAMIALAFMISMMIFGAAGMGKGFRIYTIITLILHIVFGILIGTESPNLPQNLPTPMIGVWERINIGVFMIWVIVFAVSLLGKKKAER